MPSVITGRREAQVPASLRFVIPLLAVCGCSWYTTAADHPVLQACQARCEHSRKYLGSIVKAAEAAADRIVAHPTALINVPYGKQPSFAEEMLNRSGGLARPLPSLERRKLITPHDVFLVSVRSWEQDKAKIAPLIANARKQRWLTVLFASRAGKPSDVVVDHLVDSGAADGTAEHAALNAIANAMNGGLWACEYAAALTRRGKHPGVLKSIAAPGGNKHNQIVVKDRRTLFPCETAIPAKSLSDTYLKRVDRLLDSMAGETTQNQIAKAADLIAKHIRSGGKVPMATCTHILMHEMTQNRRTPIQPFNVVWRAARAFPANVKKDDLVIFFGYIGVKTTLEDYLTPLRKTGAELITSFIPDEKDPDNNAPEAVAHIAQSWTSPDAEVPIPFPPGRMAAVSGLNQGLLWRMLEHEAAERLARKENGNR